MTCCHWPRFVRTAARVSALVAAAWSPVAAAVPDPAAHVAIADGQFTVGGHRLWINGVNLPWQHWNDFGKGIDAPWWDAQFRAMHEAGINAVRVWVNCSGGGGIKIGADGVVTGATAAHWRDLDRLFEIAAAHRIYVMATVLSFDHFRDNHPQYRAWRRWLASDQAIDSYVQAYLVPFVTRYGNSPWLWSIDLINEPEWVVENAECGRLPWERFQSYFARAARAIHENSAVLVTVGMAMPKYASDTGRGCRGNHLGDAALRKQVDDPRARLDFYETHYYDWISARWGVAPHLAPDAYGMPADKPSIIGETPAQGTAGHTTAQDYEAAFEHGWQGMMAWTFNGVDRFGDRAQIEPATRAFRDRHPSLVSP